MKAIFYTLMFGLILNQAQAQTPIVWQTLLNNYPTIPASSSTINNVWVKKTLGLSNGDLIIIGNANNEALIERRSGSGSKIWEMRIFGNNNLNDVLEASDGSLYVTGISLGISTIQNKNFNTNATIIDYFVNAQNGNYSCIECTFRSTNGQPLVQTSITTVEDWAKSNANMLLIKLSGSGDINWTRQFGGSKIDQGYSVVKADNSNIWVLGNSYSPNDGIDIVGSHFLNSGVNNQYADIMAIKVASSGQKLLSNFFGSTENESINSYNQVSSINDGGFTMVFTNTTFGTGNGDLSDATPADFNRQVVFKISSSASIQWKKYMSYGEFSSGGSMKISQSADGNIFLLDNTQFGGLPSSMPAGYHSFADDYPFGINANTNDIRATKLNSAGIELWHKYYGGKYDEGKSATVISSTSDGGAILMVDSSSPDGDVEGSFATDPLYKNDCWVVKIDQNGIIQWNRAFGGTNTEVSYGDKFSITELQNGNFAFSVIASRSNDGDLVGNTDGINNQATWLVKFQIPCSVQPPTGVTQNQRVCASTIINLSASCQTGTSIRWFEDNGTTLLTSSTIAPASTTFYRVRCKDNITNCLSAAVQTKIWVNPNPTPPVASNHVICANTSVDLVANFSGPAWGTTQAKRYESDGTTLLSNTTVTPTASNTIYKIQCETTSLYTGGTLTCKSTFTDVTVTKKDFQNEPTLTTQNQSICTGSSITLVATCNVSSNVAWYTDYFGAPLTNLTVSPTSYQQYFARCESGGSPNCKSNPKVIYLSPNSTIPTAPSITASPNSITAGESSTLSATNCGGIIKWALQNSAANPLIVMPNTTTNYTATCTVDACESGSSSVVTITVICPSTLIITNIDDISSGKTTKKASANAGGLITATNKITGTANVTYQAKSIQLNPGFRADGGTVFLVQVGGCN